MFSTKAAEKLRERMQPRRPTTLPFMPAPKPGARLSTMALLQKRMSQIQTDRKSQGHLRQSMIMPPRELQWWEKEVVEYAFSHPHVRNRLERLMGSNVTRLTDRVYMQRLAERIQEEHVSQMQHRIRLREEAEVEREKKLILEGKIPVDQVPKELAEHPVFKISRMTSEAIEFRRSKVQHPSMRASYIPADTLMALAKAMGPEEEEEEDEEKERLQAVHEAAEEAAKEELATVLMETMEAEVKREKQEVEDMVKDTLADLIAEQGMTEEEKEEKRKKDAVKGAIELITDAEGNILREKEEAIKEVVEAVADVDGKIVKEVIEDLTDVEKKMVKDVLMEAMGGDEETEEREEGEEDESTEEERGDKSQATSDATDAGRGSFDTDDATDDEETENEKLRQSVKLKSARNKEDRRKRLTILASVADTPAEVEHVSDEDMLRERATKERVSLMTEARNEWQIEMELQEAFARERDKKYVLSETELHRLRYEAPLIEQLRRQETVADLYRLADEIVGALWSKRKPERKRS